MPRYPRPIYFIFIEDGWKLGQKELLRSTWKPATGKIMEVILKEKPYDKSKKYVNTFLRYSYTLDGVNYMDTEILERNKIYPSTARLEELLVAKKQNYPSEKEIQLRVNPENKMQSTSLPASYGYFITELIFGIMGELVILFLIIRDLGKMKEKFKV